MNNFKPKSCHLVSKYIQTVYCNFDVHLKIIIKVATHDPALIWTHLGVNPTFTHKNCVQVPATSLRAIAVKKKHRNLIFFFVFKCSGKL